ncbi:hypothetical protein AYO20_08282 [Fonsecaea nubica]|uniref:Uncharacterized protein n=1 Tax=Fonsecaea nubica TaxID=856822 RepID=A0A178CP49_9EURO|nr:hypothetical protein AYO20_08282 [Fonsecaea nubica]OAL31227.1 hypothetical protein AYO20_08282 [Fonsecaea nubica]
MYHLVDIEHSGRQETFDVPDKVGQWFLLAIDSMFNNAVPFDWHQTSDVRAQTGSSIEGKLEPELLIQEFRLRDSGALCSDETDFGVYQIEVATVWMKTDRKGTESAMTTSSQ